MATSPVSSMSTGETIKNGARDSAFRPLPPQPLESSSGPRILLGIDYGTTYTGLAWMQTTGQDNVSLSDLTVFRDWPGKDSTKVPSSFTYSPTRKGCKQWGHSIDDESEVLRWTKMDLEPRTRLKELGVVKELMKGLDLIKKLHADEDAAIRNDIPRHLSKDSEDIVRDYLSKVMRHWYTYMRAQGRYTLENVPLDIIITHPASWSYQAFNKTFRAVRGAFPKVLFPTLRHIFSTSEPEACALYTIQDLLVKDHNSLFPGECFVLCDAGGGTVDLVSYYIDSIDPLVLTRVGVLTGDKCGATLIDQAFLEWLDVRLENLDLIPKDYGTGGHFISGANARQLLEKFEKDKHKFSGKETASISLPRKAKVRSEYQDGDEQLDSGQIQLLPGDLKNMFSRSVKGTCRLIAQQVTHVENTMHQGRQCQVSNIFLAGGFAESPYLFNEVKRWASSRSDTEVQRADDCWSGVVKGAVLRGMGIGMDVPGKLLACPRHCGIATAQEYQEWNHNRGDATRDVFDGELVSPAQLTWLIRQGDLIRPDFLTTQKATVCLRFSARQYSSGQTIYITYVATAALDPPSLLSELQAGTRGNSIQRIPIDLKHIPKASFRKERNQETGKVYHRADVDVIFRGWRRVIEVIVNLSSDGRKLVEYKTEA